MLLAEFNVWHYVDLAERVVELGHSGLGRDGETPEETLGKQLREHPELYTWRGGGCYELRSDRISAVIVEPRMKFVVDTLVSPLLNEYRTLTLRSLPLGCWTPQSWIDELASEEVDAAKRAEYLESVFRRIWAGLRANDVNPSASSELVEFNLM